MSKCVIFKGNTYTEEEYNNIPLAEKMEVLLTSPYLQQYLDLGYPQLSKDGMVYAVTPIAQETYKEALSEFNDVKEHSKNIIDKIREIFSKSEDLKKVDAALVVLDTLAQAWSDKTGRPKEYYYQRYLDVKQSNVSDLVGGRTLFQMVGERGIRNSQNADIIHNISVAEKMEQSMGITQDDWDNLTNLETLQKIKATTLMERGRDGLWRYEINDGDSLSLELSEPTESDFMFDGAVETMSLEDVYESAELYKIYPDMKDTKVVVFYPQEQDVIGDNVPMFYYPNEDKIYINGNTLKRGTNSFSRNTETFKSLVHEIAHAVQYREGFDQGTSPNATRAAVIDLLGRQQRGETLSGEIYERVTQMVPDFFTRDVSEGEINDVATALYMVTAGEVESRNVEQRTELIDRSSLASLQEGIPREFQISSVSNDIQAQIIGERGVVNLSDSVNRLQNLQLAKSMLNQGAPMEVVKQMTSWEQEDGVWKTEVSDMWDFTVKNMPRAGKKTTVGELIENAKVLESYPQLADIQIEFDNFSNYFAASYLPEENRVMVNKQYIKNLTDLKGSLIHELQHAVQEIEGWQQGTNPDEAGSQENYINSVGEVEARNASKRMTLTDEEKLSSLLVDSADISPEDRIYIEDVSALAARQEQPINKDFKTTENENREGFEKTEITRVGQQGRDRTRWDPSRGNQTLDGAPKIEGATGADPELTSLAEEYAQSIGVDYRRQSKYVEVDVERAERIAEAYDKMEHRPQDPIVKEAYQNLINQTIAQYRVLEQAGYKFFFFDESNDPYQGNPWEAMRDLRNNKRMGSYATYSGFGTGNEGLDVSDSPMLQDTGITWGWGSVDGVQKRVLANDLFRCFTPETLVRTSEGFKEIQDIKVGDLVLTHEGRFKKVYDTIKNPHKGKILNISTNASYNPIRVTPEHPFYVLKGTHGGQKNSICTPYICDRKQSNGNVTPQEKYHSFEWVEAKDLKEKMWFPLTVDTQINDINFIEIPNKYYKGTTKIPQKIELTEDFLSFVGLYIAEGSGGTNRINISLHKDEKYLIDLVDRFAKSIGYSVKSRVLGNGISLQINCKILKDWFSDWLGRGSDNKKIPNELLQLPPEKLKHIAYGIFSGDGKKKKNSIEQTSLTLALQLMEVGARLGLQPTANSINYSKNDKHSDTYTTHEFLKSEHNFKQKKYTWRILEKDCRNITKIEEEHYEGFVYNIEVEDDHSYVVENVPVHNCVHDAFGHGLEGAGFRARGEENAWQAHARLFTGSAVAAITSETRGQNSWLNFGKYGEQNRTAKVEDTVFAPQKTGIMPDWVWKEGFDEGSEPIKPNILFQTDKVSVEDAITTPNNTDGIYRAAVEFNSDNQAVLHALNAPNVSSLVHEFAHMFEQDLSDEDIATLEDWSGFEQGTTEFREMVAEGFEKFISEDHPELSAINQVFAKIAKWISNLYKSLTSSPLNLELSDDVRLVYAKVLGVEQAFSSRLNRSQNAILEMTNEERLLMIKKASNLKQRMPSSLPFDTKVIKKNGSIGIVGREDLSGTTQKEKADGIGDVLSYYLVSDLANIYDKSKKLTIPGKKSIVPSC